MKSWELPVGLVQGSQDEFMHGESSRKFLMSSLSLSLSGITLTWDNFNIRSLQDIASVMAFL